MKRRKKSVSNRIQKEKRWEYAAKPELFLMPFCPRVAGLYAADALDVGPRRVPVG